MANNIIRVKRSADTSVPASLANGELAWTGNGSQLFIGFSGSVIAIGGARNYGVLTANQALVTNSTSYMDRILVANLVPTKIYANASFGGAGEVLTSNGNGGIYWTTPAGGGTGDIESVTAGAGLTGGATSGDATLAVIANSGITANSTGVFVRPGNSQLSVNSTGVWLAQGNIDITALTNYDANKFVDHTSVSISAGNGLSGGGTIAATRSLAVVANNGIVANSTGVFVNPGSTLTVNSTGVHVNSALTITDLVLSGNLTVQGTTTIIDATNLSIKDNMIVVADQLANTGTFLDNVDTGWYLKSGNTSNNFYSGLARIAASSTNAVPYFRLFSTTTAPNNTVVDTSATLGILNAWLTSGALVSNGTNLNITANSTIAVALVANSLTLTTALAGVYGGTGKLTMTSQAILVGNTTNGYNELTLGTSGYVLQSNGSALVYDVLDGGTY